ncbi:MAG: response regulator [Lewinellaceae bacterium]|nr:response regulator [Lewinellaceae bacterium]
MPFPGKANAAADGDVLEYSAMGLLTNNREQLFLLQKEGSNFAPLYTIPSEAGWISSRVLPDGGVVLTGDRGYLFHFKPGDRVPEVYSPAAVGGGITGFQDGLQVMAVDRFGRAWLGSSGGYCIFDPHNRQFLRFPYQNAPDKIFQDIREFFADGKGRMWCIGPEELGWIDQAHPEQGIQQRHDRSTGFYFAPLGTLRTDKQGHVWFTCNKGLVQFSPDDRSYKIYPAGNHAMSFLPDGKLIMSFGDGVSVVHPDSLLADTALPRPYAAWFKVLDKEKQLSGSLLAPDEIRLLPNENFISIGFSILGFFKPEDYQFAYQLVGLNEDLVQADADNPVAAYTALSGGGYVFRLKVRDALGRWTIQPYELRIHIATPWYRSWPAWMFYTLLTVLAARWWLRNRDRQLIVQQQLREEQREAERLKELDVFKNRFFANITHEFRTPLTVILGMTGELEAEVKNEQPIQGLKSKIQDALPFIRRNGQRLLDLVNQMLALSRLDAGALPVQMVRGDVMNQLRILVEAFHSYAVSQKIGLQFHADPENFEMDFDPELLQRILSNLIFNALKFTEEYGNVLVSAISVQEKGQNEYLQIEVRDSGIGIAPEQLPFIFDRFYQTNAAPLRGEESSGIGLALVKEIVTLLQGRIEVASTVERGTTFRVWLPVTRQSEKAVKPEGYLIEVPTPNSPFGETPEPAGTDKPLVLVIEDNADVLEYICGCLLPDWDVVTARNGVAGLAIAQAELPDVIISDVMMPGMDGFDLTAAIKSDLRTSHIPILLLTAKSSRADILEGLSRGADDYLVKPFDKAELLLRLHNFYQQQIRWQNKPAEPEAPDPLPPSERAFLNKVDAVIEAQLDKSEFKAEHLARAVTLSRVQLHRKLSALAGISTGLYIRRYRLFQAKRLLETTDLPVSEVAWKVGFENLSWFSQAYREEFGESPRDSRKQ